jgi:SAM-dependent methyltransferase
VNPCIGDERWKTQCRNKRPTCSVIRPTNSNGSVARLKRSKHSRANSSSRRESLRAYGFFDVGCGSGDVAFLAAELVGPTGEVIGTDRAHLAVNWAAARAQAVPHLLRDLDLAEFFPASWGARNSPREGRTGPRRTRVRDFVCCLLDRR